jgi:hypothetical protein
MRESLGNRESKNVEFVLVPTTLSKMSESGHGSSRIPGVEPDSDREYLYLQSPAGTDFQRFFKRMWKIGQQPLPKSGGVMNEECTIMTPSGFEFHGISFRGDKAGWRAKALDCMHELSLLHAHVVERALVLSNGASHELSACVVMVDGLRVNVGGNSDNESSHTPTNGIGRANPFGE